MANDVMRWRPAVGVLDFKRLMQPPASSTAIGCVNGIGIGGGGGGAAFQRRDCDETVDYDPASQRQVRRRKESSQWQHPTGPGQFQQYSTVLDEQTTVAPDLHRTEQGHFEYFVAAKSNNERTRAIRSEQRVAEIRRSVHPASGADVDGDGDGQHRRLTTARSVVRLVTKVESVTRTTTSASTSTSTSGDSSYNSIYAINNNQNDWKHDFTLLEGTCNRLDHSVQLSKKNLSKNGSLSHRRRPSRSNLKSNMSEHVFRKNGNAVLDGDDDDDDRRSTKIYNNNNSHHHHHHHHHNCNNIINNNSSSHLLIESTDDGRLRFNDRQRRTSCDTDQVVSPEENRGFAHRLEPPPDLIRSIKGRDDGGYRETTDQRLGWLLEAKNRLRPSTVHLQPFEIASLALDEVQVHGVVTSNRPDTSDRRHCRVVMSTGCDGDIEEQNGVHVDVVTTSPPNVESGSSSDDDDDDTVIENDPGDVIKDTAGGNELDMGNLMEKNKSKSTSNLDDDETIEAPWFRGDVKYRKTKFPLREFAKSSQDLPYGDGEHDRLMADSLSSFVGRKPAIAEEEDYDDDDDDHGDDDDDGVRDAAAAVSEVTVNGENIGSASPAVSTLRPLSLPFFSADRCRDNDDVIIVTTNGQSIEHGLVTSSKVEYGSMPSQKVIEDSHRIRLNNWTGNQGGKKATSSGAFRRSPRSSGRRGSLEWDSPNATDDDEDNSRGSRRHRGRRSLSSPQLQCRTLDFHEESEDDGWLQQQQPSSSSGWSFAGVASAVGGPHIASIAVGDDRRRSRRRSSDDRAPSGSSPSSPQPLPLSATSDECQSFMSRAGDVVVVTGESLLDEDAWRRIDTEIERNRSRSSDRNKGRRLPDWIREAEGKRRIWDSGQKDPIDLESSQRIGRPSERSEEKASWMTEVKLRSTGTTIVKNDCGHESGSSDRDIWSPVDDSGGTAWRYVHLKPVPASTTSTRTAIGKRNDNDGDVTSKPPVSPSRPSCEDASDSSEPISSLSHFDVETYVRRQIDKSREDKRRSVNVVVGPTDGSTTTTTTSTATNHTAKATGEEPDWMKISRLKSKNVVDWNSLDHSNERKSPPESHCASWLSDVQLRRTPPKNSPTADSAATDSAAEMPRRVTPSRRSLTATATASHQTANWVSRVQLKPMKLYDTCKSPPPPSLSSASTTQTKTKTPTTRWHRPIHANGHGVDDDDDGDGDFGESRWRSSPQKSSTPTTSSKKVTFDIPRIHRSSPDLLLRSSSTAAAAANKSSSEYPEYPEWVRIAERKGSRRINWDNFEKRETSWRCTDESKWITEVQLRHVPLPKDKDKDKDENEDEDHGPEDEADEEEELVALTHVEPPEGRLLSFDSSSVGGNGSAVDVCDDRTWTTALTAGGPQSENETADIEWKGAVDDNIDVTDQRNGERVDNQVDDDIHDDANVSGRRRRGTSTRSRSTPSWIQVAELKRSASIDWTSIDRDSASKVTSSEQVNWLQEIRLRSTPTSPSRCGDLDEQHRPQSTDEGSIRWRGESTLRDGSRNNEVVDRWQALYQNLFDDLLGRPSSSSSSSVAVAEATGSGTGLNASAVRLKPRRARNWTSILEGGGYGNRSNNQRHQRFYSLPEMASCAVPRRDHEVEIIQLTPSSTRYTKERAIGDGECEEDLDQDHDQDQDQDHDDDGLESFRRGNRKCKNGAGKSESEDERKPMTFVKLRPIDARRNEGVRGVVGEATSTSASTSASEGQVREVQSGVWLQDVRLRGGYGYGYGYGNDNMASRIPEVTKRTTRTLAETARIRGSPVTMRASSSTSLSSSSPPPPSVREVIHRDIRQEVARRERTRSGTADDGPSSTTTTTTAKDKDYGLTTAPTPTTSYPSKPDWLIELQRKKAEKSRRQLQMQTQTPSQTLKPPPKSPSLPSALASTVTAKAVGETSQPPSFGSVLEQIRSMGQDNVFSCLRKTRIEVHSPTGNSSSSPSSPSPPPKLSAETNTDVSFRSSTNGHQQMASSTCLDEFSTSDFQVTSPKKNESGIKAAAATTSTSSSSSSPLQSTDDRLVTSRDNASSHAKRPSASASASTSKSASSSSSQVITVTSKWQKSEGGNETFLHEVVVRNGVAPKVKAKADVAPEVRRQPIGVKFSPATVVNDVADDDDQLKSPLLLRTLMSSLPKSKLMYSSDTELNVHSRRDASAAKVVTSNRSLLSLTSVAPSMSTDATVPYYLRGPARKEVGSETSATNDVEGQQQEDGRRWLPDGSRWLPDDRTRRPAKSSTNTSTTAKKLDGNVEHQQEQHLKVALTDFSDVSVQLSSSGRGGGGGGDDLEELRIVESCEQNHVFASQ